MGEIQREIAPRRILIPEPLTEPVIEPSPATEPVPTTVPERELEPA